MAAEPSRAYKLRIDDLAKKAQTALAESYGVSLDFSAPHVPGRRPGDADSEFLANRGMGDWAERSLQQALSSSLSDYVFVKYGNDSAMVAGDPKFSEFYTTYQSELGSSGKRPDILAFARKNYNPKWGTDISNFSLEELASITPLASFAVEVRSSKFFADEYKKIREAEGARSARATQSFTVKVEDLRIVKRWIDTYGVRHFYAQVFFDCVYIIPFEGILELLAGDEEGITVEKNRRNQNKRTIHIPISYGRRLGTFVKPPTFETKTRKTRLARLDAYVSPIGGDLKLTTAVLSPLLK